MMDRKKFVYLTSIFLFGLFIFFIFIKSCKDIFRNRFYYFFIRTKAPSYIVLLTTWYNNDRIIFVDFF